uniref:Uncharacterized protein n=1 Tax=Heterorhabditis bacteriophora TaxID=37862 RepID=A0A1I7X9Z0_HETBA
MSKRTFIQKWDPHQLFKNTITRTTGRRGRGYRKKTNDDLGIVCRTIYNPNEVVYNDMSSAGRRAVQRDIGHIVAPEEEVEWARAPITCTLNGNNRLPYAIDDEQEINVITDAKKRLHYDPYVQNEEFVQRNRRSEPIYDGDEHPPALMRGKRRLEQNYSVRMDKHKTFEFNACSENDSCDALSSGVPFRSTEIATRILSSLPQLSLRDDESKKYDTVASQNIVYFSCFKLFECSSEFIEQHDLLFYKVPLLICIYLSTPGLGIESTSPPDTPNIERLFNQTVGYPMLTPCSIDPDSLHHVHESGMRSCISTDSFAPVHSANTTRRNHTIKSTPSVHSSAKSPKLTTRNRSDTVSQLQFKWPCVQEPFTRFSSPSSSESDDFEWTLPPPNRDVYDIVREKQAQTTTGDLNDLF